MAGFNPHAGIELESVGPCRLKAPDAAQVSTTRRSASIQRSSSKASNASPVTQPQRTAPTQTSLHVQPAWNEPRINMVRVPLLFFDFFVIGMNDGSYGSNDVSCLRFLVD